MDNKFLRKKNRIRAKIRKQAIVNTKPRITVFKSNQYIYAQIIDDRAAKTLVAASSLDKDLRASLKNTSNVLAAQAVGDLLAQRAKKRGIKDVIYDRSGYVYHGKIKALADKARAGGLNF